MQQMARSQMLFHEQQWWHWEVGPKKKFAVWFDFDGRNTFSPIEINHQLTEMYSDKVMRVQKGNK
jgi:hypothetical protein